MANRRKFIEAYGATCRNWAWSWAFLNAKKRFVIFGAWDYLTKDGVAQILDEAWERSRAGRKNAAFPEALEYVRLIEAGTHKLFVFRMLHSQRRKSDSDSGPAAIKGFAPELQECSLSKVGTKWFATPRGDLNPLPEEVTAPGTYVEGTATTVLVNAYERNPKARAACIAKYGAKCAVCGFSFDEAYGPLGTGYIHVHHLVPLASIGTTYALDPVRDLRPVCPNCHAMIHRSSVPLAIEELQALLQR